MLNIEYTNAYRWSFLPPLCVHFVRNNHANEKHKNLMKTLERLVLVHLRSLVGPSMDPLQFAYQPNIGVDDAIIFLLHRALSHLERP